MLTALILHIEYTIVHLHVDLLAPYFLLSISSSWEPSFDLALNLLPFPGAPSSMINDLNHDYVAPLSRHIQHLLVFAVRHYIHQGVCNAL
jgi:hypothetical protein